MTAARRWLRPLIPLYRMGVHAKNVGYDRGWLSVRRLPQPVISVGSLSAGGAGKTPVVAMLMQLLHEASGGPCLDILSRGYGRKDATVGQVQLSDPAVAWKFGDEPVELARCGWCVFVGSDRYEAGVLAERSHASSGHLLDDGFQHRRLARDFEIVLLTAQEVDDQLLPAGNLREPLTSLRRANAVILREEEELRLRPIVLSHCKAEIWVIRRELVVDKPFRRPFLFCGIARPESFFAMVRKAGYSPAGTITFPDHHAYTVADVDRILHEAEACNADGFYTTSKDAVKLSARDVERLKEAGGFHAPVLQVSLRDPEAARTRLNEVLGRG